MTLERLALSRSTLDRAAHRRADPLMLDALLADPGTLVLVLAGSAAPVIDEEAGPALALLPATAFAGVRSPLAMFLGEDAGGTGYLALAWPAADRPATDGRPTGGPAVELPSQVAALPLPAGARWAGLREVGSLLGDADAGMLTAAVALSAWHASHPRCARCGDPTDVVQAGWSRTCPSCAGQHFPRTDPAVIMAVVDDDDRILLGRQATWPVGRFSTLAGFVEPGESLEAAVRREVAEEAGIAVGEVTYRGSQPWPFPSSLMLGFRARAVSTEVKVDGVELAEAGWWTRDALARDVAGGDLRLPPAVSIARRLIEDWYGGPLPSP